MRTQDQRTLRGAVAVVGVGESTYFRHGESPDPEFVLVLRAVLAACDDAGVDPRAIDGFSSYAMDRNAPVRLAAALGVRELRSSIMQWGGGGGGMAAALANAAAAVATGQAECVAVTRGLAQGQFGRFGVDKSTTAVAGPLAHTIPYGCATPGQTFAMRWTRWMHEHDGVGLLAQEAISLTSYHHARGNPRALMSGRELSSDTYRAARWIVEPWRLYDFCQESDGAACVLVVPAQSASDAHARPVYLVAAAQGADHRWGASVHNSPSYATSNFSSVAPRLWEMARLRPADVDVVQSYENFTGGVVMSLVEHGFCSASEVDHFLTETNLRAPSGCLPLNTSGGNLAEAYTHGLNLLVEAVRQLRNESVNQVPSAKVALVTAGPLTAPVSDVLLGTADVL